MNDAQEFGSWLLNVLSELTTSKRVKRRRLSSESEQSGSGSASSTVSNFFKFELVSNMSCPTFGCCHVAVKCEDIFLLQLNLIGNGKCDLSTLLQKFTSTETLEDSEMAMCDRCEVKCMSSRRIEINSTPALLIVQLKRFDASHQYLSNPVSFPLTGLIVTTASGAASFYDCVAISEFSEAHYVSYGQRSELNSWFYFNDTKAVVVTLKTMEHKSKNNKHAYLLFYLRRT